MVENIFRARDVTTDEFGNLYVASGYSVLVFAPDGREIGELPIVTDPAHVSALEEDRQGHDYSLLSLAFGGRLGNTLFVSMGHDMRGREFIERDLVHVLGGLWRIDLKARGSWTVQ